MPLSSERGRAVIARLRALGVHEADLNEKVATCVVLVHRPTGASVKCQRERTQGQNRVIARQLLADKIETERLGRASARAQEAARIRRQKRRRSRRAKERMLATKHARSDTKAARTRVRDQGD